MSGLAIIVRELLDDAAVHGLVADRVLPHQASEATAPPLLSVFVVSRLPDRTPASLAHSTAYVTERVQVDAVVPSESPHLLQPLLNAVHRACANRLPAAAGDATDIVIRPAGRGPQLPDDSRHTLVQSLDFMVSFNEPTGLT